MVTCSLRLTCHAYSMLTQLWSLPAMWLCGWMCYVKAPLLVVCPRQGVFASLTLAIAGKIACWSQHVHNGSTTQWSPAPPQCHALDNKSHQDSSGGNSCWVCCICCVLVLLSGIMLLALHSWWWCPLCAAPWRQLPASLAPKPGQPQQQHPQPPQRQQSPRQQQQQQAAVTLTAGS